MSVSSIAAPVGPSATLPESSLRVSALRRCGRSATMKSAGRSRGDAQWSAPTHDPAETESAPVRRPARSATPPEVMRREFVHANFRGELFDDVPDRLFRNSLARDALFRAAYRWTEKAALVDSGGRRPLFNLQTPGTLGVVLMECGVAGSNGKICVSKSRNHISSRNGSKLSSRRTPDRPGICPYSADRDIHFSTLSRSPSSAAIPARL